MSANLVDARKSPEFDNHDAVMSVADERSGLKAYIAIHHVRGAQPSFGATRWWRYPSQQDAMQDAMRLAHLMSYKSALAGLPYGGAKGVIFSDGSPGESRTRMLEAYAGEVERLGGKFVTGTDVGLTREDVARMRCSSSFFVGLAVDPAMYTTLGMFESMKVCLGEVFDSDRLQGRSFAVQGLGKIGTSIIELLMPHGVTVFASDVSQSAVEQARRRFPSLRIVSPEDIYKTEADIFSPCALGGSLYAGAAKNLQCRAIVGGANNQLANGAVGDTLHQRGILYAPDYVANAGGLISVTQEYEYGTHNESRVCALVEVIPQTLKTIFSASRKSGRPPGAIADEMARAIIYSKE